MLDVILIKDLLKESKDIKVKNKKDEHAEKLENEFNLSFNELFNQEINKDEVKKNFISEENQGNEENKVKNKVINKKEEKIEEKNSAKIDLISKGKELNSDEIKIQTKKDFNRNTEEEANLNKITDKDFLSFSIFKNKNSKLKNSDVIIMNNNKEVPIHTNKTKKEKVTNENLSSINFKNKVLSNKNFSKERPVEKVNLEKGKNDEIENKIKNDIKKDTKKVLNEKKVFIELKDNEVPKNQKNETLLVNNEFKKPLESFIEKIAEPKNLTQIKDIIFDQIAKNTKIFLTDNKTSFSTMIRPDNIGRIDFKFLIKEGKAIGKLIVHNNEAYEFFRSNVIELKAVFEKANVELENLDIILAGNKFLDNSNEGEKQNKNETSENMTKIIGVNQCYMESQFEEKIQVLNTPYFDFLNTKINLVI